MQLLCYFAVRSIKLNSGTPILQKPRVTIGAIGDDSSVSISLPPEHLSMDRKDQTDISLDHSLTNDPTKNVKIQQILQKSIDVRRTRTYNLWRMGERMLLLNRKPMR